MQSDPSPSEPKIDLALKVKSCMVYKQTKLHPFVHTWVEYYIGKNLWKIAEMMHLRRRRHINNFAASGCYKWCGFERWLQAMSWQAEQSRLLLEEAAPSLRGVSEAGTDAAPLRTNPELWRKPGRKEAPDWPPTDPASRPWRRIRGRPGEPRTP